MNRETSRQDGPPSFEEAVSRRQKTRAAGMHPDYWYAAEHSHRLRRGQTVEVKFWNTSIALYRGKDGQLRAIENRCAHRQLKLSLGSVEENCLTCPYHGWSYDGSGKLVSVAHDLFGKPMLRVQLRSYPVQERYGLIWIFPGDPARALDRRIPEIPELEGPRRWACVPVDFTWKTHHSMVIDNVSDFTHAYLHRKYRPFVGARLVRTESSNDRVSLVYDAQIGQGKISGLFVDRKRVKTDSIELCYEYPYQWSDTGGRIKHWCFLLPMDERTTRAFFLFYFDALRIPFTPIRIPRWLMSTVLRIANRVMIRPLLAEDGFAVEAEQEGYQAHPDAPLIEINPVISLFQQLTINKWEEYLASRKGDQPAPESVEVAGAACPCD